MWPCVYICCISMVNWILCCVLVVVMVKFILEMKVGWIWFKLVLNRNVEDYVTLKWFCDIMEMKLSRCELWLWLMKLEDGNMLWMCMLTIRSFGWIMVLVENLYILYILWIFCKIMWNASELHLNGLELVNKYEMLILVWKCKVGVEVVMLCRKKDYLY